MEDVADDIRNITMYSLRTIYTFGKLQVLVHCMNGSWFLVFSCHLAVSLTFRLARKSGNPVSMKVSGLRPKFTPVKLRTITSIDKWLWTKKEITEEAGDDLDAVHDSEAYVLCLYNVSGQALSFVWDRFTLSLLMNQKREEKGWIESAAVKFIITFLDI